MDKRIYSLRHLDASFSIYLFIHRALTNSTQPLLHFLLKKFKKEEMGWLCISEIERAGEKRSNCYWDAEKKKFKPLTEQERLLYTLCGASLPPAREIEDVNPKQVLDYTWGILRSTGKDC